MLIGSKQQYRGRLYIQSHTVLFKLYIKYATLYIVKETNNKGLELCMHD